MLAIRTDWNRNKAALAKSVLENYEISCALLHENANVLYPFAMPIRLFVTDDQVDRAIAILNGNFEQAAEIEMREESDDASFGRPGPQELVIGTPWELLVLAFYLVLPAVCVLQTKYPTVLRVSRRIEREIAAVRVFHFIGWLAIAVAAFLIVIYLRVWRSSAKSGLK